TGKPSPQATSARATGVETRCTRSSAKKRTAGAALVHGSGGFRAPWWNRRPDAARAFDATKSQIRSAGEGVSRELSMARNQIPHLSSRRTRAGVLMKEKIAIFWPGDARDVPNQLAKPSIDEATAQLERALKKLGREPYLVPGILSKPHHAIQK